MSCLGENKNKFPVEIISKLLTKLLDSRLYQLEKKAKEEMDKIKSASKNTNFMINELQVMNKKIKPNLNNKKSIINKSINLQKRNNFIYRTSTSKLNSTIVPRRTKRATTPDRICFSKIKDTKKNCLKKLKFQKSEVFFDDFLGCKSNNTSRILNAPKKRDSNGLIRKNVRHLTRSTTLCSLRRKIMKEKPKPNNLQNLDLSLMKNNHSNPTINLHKSLNQSSQYLPFFKKEKLLNKSFLSKSSLSKKEELDLICSQTQYNDKRIFGLNPDADKSLLELNRKGSISSTIFTRKTNDLNVSKIEDNNDLLKLDDNLMDEVNNDELLIFYHNKQTVKLIDDITLDKSFLSEDIKEKDLNLEIKSNNHKKIDKKANNLIKNKYTFDEKIEIMLEHLTKYLNKEDLLKIGLINKSCFKIIMYHLISKKEDYIDELKESLSSLKKKNPEIIEKINNNNFNLKIKFNEHTNRAIKLLNEIPKVSFLNNKSIDIYNKYIILVFDLFFIALGFKKKILSFKNNTKLKWNFYKNYLLNDNNEYFGHVITNLVKGIVLDDDKINSLYEYSYNYLNFITPNFFKKTNNEMALFVFIVKNILDQVGITKDVIFDQVGITKDVNNKNNVNKLYKLYNVRINYNSSILKKLNKINEIISTKNKF